MGARSSPGAGETIHAVAAYPAQGAGTAKLDVVRTRSRVLLPVVLSASLVGPGLLAGCSGEDPRPSAATSAPTTSAGSSGAASASTGVVTDTDAATDAPPFPGDTAADTAQPSAGAQVTVTAVRIGAHEGFDRVVFEFGGTGKPGWNVRYVDSAVAQGSGKPVHVTGDAVLQLSFSGAGYPYATGVTEYAGANPLAAAGTKAVTEMAFGGTFEGTTEAFIGARAKTPFRVYLLDSPVRVVVDVADAG